MNVFKIEHDLIPIISSMEMLGVRIDIPLLERVQLRLTSLKIDFEAKIMELSRNQFNINSNAQLSTFLFDELGLEPKNKELTKASGYKVNKEHLDQLLDQHKVVQLILDYRKTTKQIQFCGQLNQINPKTKRLHASFNQIGTETGRFSSSKPNLQNIPNPSPKDGETNELKLIEAEFRKMFVPRVGWYFVCADYSQVELRVMAEFSRDPFLIDAFSEKKTDLHKLTASEIFNKDHSDVNKLERSIAKSINFGLIYGKTAYGLAGDLTRITGEPYTVERAQEVIDEYFSKLPLVKQCLDNFINQADEKGYAETLYGRRRPIPQLSSNKLKDRQAGKRIAMNTPIQGTAADIIKTAMIKCSNTIKSKNLKSRLLLTVHDELLFEVPPEELELMEGLVRNNMENAVKLSIPLEVDLKTAKNWAEAH